MEIELYNKGTLDREFMTQPEFLAKLREHRIVETYSDSPDRDFRIVPGDRRDLMALPAASIDGKCDDDYYIDLRISGDDGAVYVGSSLFHHLANLVGYCQVEELRRANKKIEELEKELERSRRNLNRMRLVSTELGDMEPAKATDSASLSGRSGKGGSPEAA